MHDPEPATARRLSSLALVTGGVAAVLVVVAASVDGDDRVDGTDGTDPEALILGVVLILLPFLCAAATRSVASSTLLRPVGVVAAVMAALAAAIHVAVAVDEHGDAGYAYGAAAIATVLFVVAAVIRGPSPRPGLVDAVGTAPGPPPDPSGLVAGPPLDVTTPLRDARTHAAKAVLAWTVVLAATAVTAPPLLRLLGWPTVVERLDARVVAVGEPREETAVTFEAHDGDRRVRWTIEAEDPGWELGDRVVAFLDEDGGVHLDQQWGLAGLPLLLPWFIIGGFAGFAVRRLWGLLVAWWDLHHDGLDAPRLGYAALIHDPAPKNWRPLLAVWDRDPTSGERLARPDAVYRADEETGAELESSSAHVEVRRAWIDTGMSPRSKPRWIGVEGGVVVPHRRAILGRWYLGKITRRSEVMPVIELRHGPPAPELQSLHPQPSAPSYRLTGMVAWRLLALVASIGLAALLVDSGERAEIDEARAARASVSVGYPRSSSSISRYHTSAQSSQR